MTTEDDVLTKLAETLRVERSALTIHTSAADIGNWDSMGALEIAFMLESEYGIVLSFEEAETVRSVPGILSCLRSAGQLP